MKTLRLVGVFCSGMAVLTASAVAMLVVRAAHLGGGRRFCQERIGAWAGKALLRINRLELQVHRKGPWPTMPCFYMANHSSTLDMPVLMSLGLPNARTFIKERFRWYGPLGLQLMLTGTLFTAPQEDHERRVRRFMDAEEVLRRSGDSVFGSPEGTRVPGHAIGPFNRGVFHIVTSLHLPIVPLLIRIPRAIDPGRGLVPEPGTLHVHVGEPIDTSTWTLQDLDANKERVRDRFVAWQEELSA